MSGLPLIERKQRLRTPDRQARQRAAASTATMCDGDGNEGLRARCAGGHRGHRLQERRPRPTARGRSSDLAEDQMRAAPGIRHRRLDAVGQAGRLRVAAPRRARGRRAASTAGRVGTGFDDRHLDDLARQIRKLARARPRPSTTCRAMRRGANGSSRSSSPRSPSRSSPATAFCATLLPRAARGQAGAARSTSRGRTMEERPKMERRRPATDRRRRRSPIPTRCCFPDRASPSATSSAYYEARRRAHAAAPRRAARSAWCAARRAARRQVLLPEARQRRLSRAADAACPITEKDGGKADYFYVDDLAGHRRRRPDGRAGVPHLGLARRRRSKSPTASSSTSTRTSA